MGRDFKKHPLKKRSAPFGGPTNEPAGNPSPPPGNPAPTPGNPAPAGGDSPIDPAMNEEMGIEEEPMDDPMAPEEEALPEENIDEPMSRMPEPTPSVQPEININAETGESSIEFPGLNINITTEDSGLGTLQASKHSDVGTDSNDRDWVDFMKGNKPEVEDPDPLSKDTHEYIMNNPKNRRVPNEVFDIAVHVGGKYEDAFSIQFALEQSLNAQVDLEMPSESDPDQDYVVVRSVENPSALIEELAGYGLDAELVSGNLNDIYEGMKVSFLGDLPEIGYYYDPMIGMEARVTSISDNQYYLYNNKFGHFIADVEEIDV